MAVGAMGVSCLPCRHPADAASTCCGRLDSAGRLGPGAGTRAALCAATLSVPHPSGSAPPVTVCRCLPHPERAQRGPPAERDRPRAERCRIGWLRKASGANTRRSKQRRDGTLNADHLHAQCAHYKQLLGVGAGNLEPRSYSDLLRDLA